MRALAATLLILVVFAASACTPLAARRPLPGGVTVGGQFPQELDGWRDSKLDGAGACLRDAGGLHRILLLTAGMCSSGGWSVEVESVLERNGTYVVTYRVIAPKRGQMVTEAITYPYEHVRLPSDGKAVEVYLRDRGLKQVSVVVEPS